MKTWIVDGKPIFHLYLPNEPKPWSGYIKGNLWDELIILNNWNL